MANDTLIPTLSREGGAGHFIDKYYDVTEEYIIRNLDHSGKQHPECEV